MRLAARLLVALALVGGASIPAPGAPPTPPSVFAERPSGGASGQRADPALRQRFEAAYAASLDMVEALQACGRLP